MRLIRLVGLAFIAVLAVSAMAASTASAFPQFLMLPSSKTFKDDSGAGTLTTAGQVVKCTSDLSTGEVTSMDSVGNVVVTFHGCKLLAGGKECTIKSVEPNSGSEGLIVTTTLKGLLGTVKTTESKTGVGLLLEPEKGPIFTTLGKAGACEPPETAVEGSVAGEVEQVKVLQSTGKLNFTASGTSQSIKEINLLSGLKKTGLKAYGVTATEATIDELLFNGSVEIC